MRNKTLPWATAAILIFTGSAALDAPAASAKFGDKALRQGSDGRDVRVLQRWLTLVGFETAVDGNFGRRTARTVRSYERHHEMRVDGRFSRVQARGLRKRAHAARAGGDAAAPVAVDRAVLAADGRTAVAPPSAPEPVKAAIAAANEITSKPYRYGGGHGSFADSGYDCSGAVSYALHGAGVLEAPLASGALTRFGSAGEGRWITVYAHGSHTYVVIAGLRFDTSGDGESGPRWREASRSGRGYEVRHPEGL